MQRAELSIGEPPSLLLASPLQPEEPRGRGCEEEEEAGVPYRPSGCSGRDPTPREPAL